MAPPPVIIVGSLGHDGGSLTVALLQAGGVDVAGASAPFFELPQAAHAVRPFIQEFLPQDKQHLFELVWSIIPKVWKGSKGGIDPDWFATLAGSAIKVMNPHLVSIPPGRHRAIMLDRSSQSRVTTAIRYMGIDGDRPGLREHMEAYYAGRQPVARAALKSAGADVLDVDYEDLTGGPDRCRMAIDCIVDFIGRPLDRDAMVERVAEYERRQDDLVHRLRDDLPAAFKWLAPRGR